MPRCDGCGEVGVVRTLDGEGDLFCDTCILDLSCPEYGDYGVVMPGTVAAALPPDHTTDANQRYGEAGE